MTAIPSNADASMELDTGVAPRTGVRRWLGKGLWGLLDTGLFAGGNFLTHVMLARWLPEERYGAFTTAFAIYLLFGTIHTSLLIEPMMVYGSQRYRRRLPGYLGELVRVHATLCLGYAMTLLAIAGVELWLDEDELAGTLVMFAVAQFALLLPWVLRDACYIESNPRPAGTAGVIYVSGAVLGILSLRSLGWLSLPAAVGVLGGSAVLASVYLLTALRLWSRLFSTARRWRLARLRHWRFGRWSLTTNLIRYAPEHLPLVIVPAMLGYASGGALKAMVNLITPFVLMTWAMSNLLLPLMVRRVGTPAFEALARRVIVLVTLGPLVCWPLLGLFAEPIIHVLYQGKFEEQAWVLWVLGAMPVLVSVNCILYAMFRALDRPGLLLPASISSAIVVLAVGVPLLAWFGLWGMVAGMLSAQLVQGCWLLWLYVTRLRGFANGRSVASGPRKPDEAIVNEGLTITSEPVP